VVGVQIGLLGPLEVRSGDRLIPVAGSRLRRLLTRLAVDAGRPVPAAELVDAVWPDDAPADITNSLQSLVSRLRRALGEATLIQQLPIGYRLAVEATAVDVVVFTDLAATGHERLRAGDPLGARAALVEALALWRGPALVDADDAPYTTALVARWDTERVAALGDRIDADLALGAGPEVIGELDELVAAYPRHEQFVGRLMEALAATGRTADALAAYQALRERLAEELGADPGPELAAQHIQLLRGMEPAEPAPARRTNLRAAVSSFVGREAELARVAALLDTARLTTIVGPGGAGKTRLATQAAAPWVDRARDGVWLVELAPITEESSLPRAVLSALGMQANGILERRELRPGMTAADRVFATLADSDALLVIDNCEHLIAGVAALAEELLERCPSVRVLTTSREPLGIPGEALCAMPPLGLPPEHATATEAADYPAVQLLLARGSAARADFALTADTVRPIVQVVRRLDGLPLAIELAAARLRVLPISEIAGRLDDRFRLLAGGIRTAVARHRTLRAVVEWSWDLLSPDERLLAERLAVFPAGATTAAAVAVCGVGALAAEGVPELLLALVDKSLLQVTGDDGDRYRMLETIREYGVERLAERGELGAARAGHATYFAALAHRLDPKLRTSDQIAALAQFGAERENVLAALRYLGDSGSAGAALALLHDLEWWWNITGNHSDLMVWSQFVLDVTEGMDVPARIKAESMRVLSLISSAPSQNEGSWEDLKEKLETAASRLAALGEDDDPMTLMVQLVSAFFLDRTGDIEDLLAVGQRARDPWLRAMSRTVHVMFLENNGDVDAMRVEVDQAFAAFEAIGDRWGLSSVLAARASIRAMDGDVAGAIADYEQAGACLRELGSTEDDLMIRTRLAGLRVRQGDFAGARAEIALARRVPDDRPPEMERILMADAALIGVALAEGDLPWAQQAADHLRQRVAGTDPHNPIYQHLLAMTGAICACVAIRVDDLQTAADDLVAAYPAGVAGADRPILALVAVAIAMFAEALGRPRDGAEILGAAARLRGSADEHDVQIARLRADLITEIGPTEFADCYRIGWELPQDAAAKRVDPAPLVELLAESQRPTKVEQ
jgi:predicted ATPase/DNA-binding SARP family transcriptional activator